VRVRARVSKSKSKNNNPENPQYPPAAGGAGRCAISWILE